MSGRDVSHLQDKLKIPVSRINELPSDIKTLKKLLENSDPLGNPLNKGHPLSCSCRKEVCMDTVYKQNTELPSIEKLYLGPPTGRQECNNLRKWFENMKETYCVDGNTEENSRVLFGMCSKELIRQVSVQCLERGELLKEVFEFFINSYEKTRENLKNVEKNSEKLKNEIFESYENKEKNLKEVVQKTEEKNQSLSLELNAQNKEIERLTELARVASEKLDDFSYKFNEEKSLRAIHSIRNSSYNSSNQRKRFRPSFIHSHLVKYPKHEFLLRFDKANQTDFQQKTDQFLNVQKHKEKLFEADKKDFFYDKESPFSDKESQTQHVLEIFLNPVVLFGNVSNTFSELISGIHYKTQEIDQNTEDKQYEILEKMNVIETDELSVRKTITEDFSTKKISIEDLSLNLFSNESPKPGELTPTISANTVKNLTTSKPVAKSFKRQTTDLRLKFLKDLEDSITIKQAQYELLEKKIQDKMIELSKLSQQVLNNEDQSIKSLDFNTSLKEKMMKPLSFNLNSTMDVVEETENVNNYSVLIAKDTSLLICEQDDNEENSHLRKSLSQSFLTPKKVHKIRLNHSHISNLSQDLEENLSQRSESLKNDENIEKEANESRIESFEDYENTSIYEGKKSIHEHKQKHFNPTEIFEFRFNQRTHKDINKKNPGKRILLTVLSKKIE